MAAKKAKSNITEVESGVVSNWKKENSERLSDIKRVNEPLFNAIGMALSFINKKLGGTEITMDDIVVESPRVVGKLTEEQLENGVGITRFKTEQELANEYGVNWRDSIFKEYHDDWAEAMDSILGKPLEGMEIGVMEKGQNKYVSAIFSSEDTSSAIFDGFENTAVKINNIFYPIFPNIIKDNQSNVEVVEQSKRSAIGRWFVKAEADGQTPFQVVNVDLSNPIVDSEGKTDYWAKINYSTFEPIPVQLENISILELSKSIESGDLIEINSPDFLIGEKAKYKNSFSGWDEVLIVDLEVDISNNKKVSADKISITYRVKDILKGFLSFAKENELQKINAQTPKAGEWYSIPSGNKLLYIESDDADDYDVTEFSASQARGSQFAYEKQSFADAVIGGAYIKRPAPVFKMGAEILYESKSMSGIKMEDGEVFGYIGWDDKLGYEYWLRDTVTNTYFEKTYDGHNIVLKQSVTAAPIKRILEGFYASANENVYELSVNPKNPQEFITEIWDATAAETSYSYARMLELIEQQKLIRLPRAPLFKSGELLYVNGFPFNDDLQHKVFGIEYLPNTDTFNYQMLLGDSYYWLPEEKLAYTPFNKSNNSVSLETKMPESSSSSNEDIDFDALADELENLDI